MQFLDMSPSDRVLANTYRIVAHVFIRASFTLNCFSVKMLRSISLLLADIENKRRGVHWCVHDDRELYKEEKGVGQKPEGKGITYWPWWEDEIGSRRE